MFSDSKFGFGLVNIDYFGGCHSSNVPFNGQQELIKIFCLFQDDAGFVRASVPFLRSHHRLILDTVFSW